MTVQTNFSSKRTIPSVTTKKSAPTTTNFAKGIKTYKPNDTMGYDEIYLAQNARFERIGEYSTRRGFDKLCEPIGKTTAINTYDVGYTMSDLPTTGTSVTMPANAKLYSITIKVQSTDTKYGVLQAYIENSDGEVIAESFLDPKTLITSPTDVELVFANAPTVTAGNVLKIFLKVQNGGLRTFKVATISGNIMTKVDTCAAGHVGNIFEANVNSVKTVFFTFVTESACALYAMAQDGTVTKIRDLPNTTRKVRFSQNINEIRYASNESKLHKLSYVNSAWVDTAIDVKDLKTDTEMTVALSNIMNGTQDNLMYFNSLVDTQAIWSYPYGFAYAPEAEYSTSGVIPEYDSFKTTQSSVTLNNNTFTPDPSGALAVDTLIVDANGNYGVVTASTSTTATVTATAHSSNSINSYDKFNIDFYQSFPAIQTGDPLTAMFNLGGVIYIMTRRNKYQAYFQTADVWTQSTVNAQNGTFSQESIVCDLNYAYFANDKGVFVFDGSSEVSLTENSIQNVYDAIENKDSIRLDMFNNRLYVFYSSTGTDNDSCLVYNINLKLWESFDSKTYVSATSARQNASNRFICGHSGIGLLMLAESNSNDYDNLGGAIDFDLNTSYMTYGSPSQLKVVTKLRPEFGATDNPYSVACGYAMDFTDNVKYAFSIDLLKNQIARDQYVWDNPSNYGVTTQPTKITTLPKVYGEFRRLQIRYQHHAAFEPVGFRSHTVTVQTQRIR